MAYLQLPFVKFLLALLPLTARCNFLGVVNWNKLTPPPFVHKSPAQIVSAVGNEASKAGVTQQGAVDSLADIKETTAQHVATAQRAPGMAAQAAMSSTADVSRSVTGSTGVDFDLDSAEQQARQAAGQVEQSASETAARAGSSVEALQGAAAEGIGAFKGRDAIAHEGVATVAQDSSSRLERTDATLEASFRPESSVRRDWSSLSGLPVMFVLFGVAYVWAQRRKVDRLKSLEQLSQALDPRDASSQKPIIQVAPPQDRCDLELLKV